MLLGRDLQDGGDGLHVGVDGVADHLSDELIDQDDGDVTPSQEAPAERETFSSEQTSDNVYENLRSLDLIKLLNV